MFFRRLDQSGRHPAWAEHDRAAKPGVLMLQGHPSLLWPELGDRLAAEGHRVVKVHLSLPDRLVWGRRPGLSYRGDLAGWKGWLRTLIAREDIREVIYHNDRLPFHAVARDLCDRLGARAWTLEFGYLRPDWLTFEEGGMNGKSRFPRDPAHIRALAAGKALPDAATRYPHHALREWTHESIWLLLKDLGRAAYTKENETSQKAFVAHVPAVLRELLRMRRRRVDLLAAEREVWKAGLPYNLIALQLLSDTQVSSESRYAEPDAFLEDVMASFARHAPASRRLIIKEHPFDPGIVNWPRRVRQLTARHGLEGRVHLVRGGCLRRWLTGSQGAVMINSTVGVHALRLGVPVCALGDAIYKLDGLVHRRGLDSFWTTPAPVDPAMRDDFLRALTTVQVRGSFYNADGRRAAINAICARLGDSLQPRSQGAAARGREALCVASVQESSA